MFESQAGLSFHFGILTSLAAVRLGFPQLPDPCFASSVSWKSSNGGLSNTSPFDNSHLSFASDFSIPLNKHYTLTMEK